MNDNDLEKRLRTQTGPRERGYAPGALPATIADATVPRRSRGVLSSVGRTGLIAATVVAGTALALVVTRGAGPGQNSVGSGATPSAGQTTVQSPSGQPLAACTADDFAWATDPWTGAAGSRGTSVLMRGVASLTGCRIDGAASLQLRDANGEVVLSGMSAPSSQLVTSGAVLEVGVSWSNWCGGELTQPLSVDLTLPGDSTQVPLIAPNGSHVTIPPCNGEGAPSVLNATDVQVSDRAFPDG
jgi:hypothetical protein